MRARCRPIYGVEDESQREVRISCPDATGLGCDFARLLLDFGLRILDGAPPSCVALTPGVPRPWRGPLTRRQDPAL